MELLAEDLKVVVLFTGQRIYEPNKRVKGRLRKGVVCCMQCLEMCSRAGKEIWYARLVPTKIFKN